MDYKTGRAFTKAINDRTVDGIFAVHGNIDDGDWYTRDRSHPGLFGDGLVNGRSRAVFLWQHDSSAPPIATIDQIYEVGMADLPDAVRSYAPDATGGVGVRRTYLDTPRGNEVLAGLRAGAIAEMSYAYEPVKWDFEEVEGVGQIRNLYRANLYDVSDVNWGMNPATSADGSKGQPLMIEAAAARAAVKGLIARYEALHSLRVVKEGRRFSAATLQEIESTIADLKTATGRLSTLVAATDDGGDDDGKTGRRRTQEAYQHWAQLQARLARMGITGA